MRNRQKANNKEKTDREKTAEKNGGRRRRKSRKGKTAKRSLIIFLIFFLGTSGLTAADTGCREATGKGGNLSLKMTRQEDGAISAEFLGQRVQWEYPGFFH